MKQETEDTLLAEQILSDFYSNSNDLELFSDYLTGKTDELPKEAVLNLCGGYYSNYYSSYQFDKDYDKNPKQQAMVKKMLAAIYKIKPEYLERFLQYHPKCLYFFKTAGVSSKFMEQHFENFLTELLQMSFYYRLHYLNKKLKEIEKETPEWVSIFENQYEELSKPLKAVALLWNAYQGNKAELKKRFPEIADWCLQKKRKQKEMVFVFLLLTEAKTMEKTIRKEAGQLLLNWPFSLFHAAIGGDGNSEFINLCQIYHAPPEAEIRFGLFSVSHITYYRKNAEEKRLEEYAKSNSRNFNALMKNLLLSKDLLSLTSYAFLKKAGVIPKKYAEDWKEQCRELIQSKLAKFYEDSNYTSLFLFEKGKEGDFSGLSQSDLTQIGFEIEDTDKILYYAQNDSLFCLLYSCTLLMREFVEARNIVILFADAVSCYSLNQLNILEHCLFLADTKQLAYDYLYELGVPLQTICKITLSWNTLLNPVSKSEILGFLKKHREEAVQIVSDYQLPLELYPKYLTLLYEKEEGFEIAPLAHALTLKAKSVVNCAENLLAVNGACIRENLEEIAKLKNKTAADAAMRIIRLWDNDKIEQEMKQLSDQKSFTAYIIKRFTKSHEKNVPFADQIDYGQVRFSDSEERIEPEVLKFYIAEYVLLKNLYPVKACQQIQHWTNLYDLQKLLTQIYELWISEGAGNKFKNILFPYALCAGTSQLEALKKQIDDWAQNSKPGLAAFGVQCLAWNAGKLALLMTDTISKKHKNKKVRKAAEEALKQTMAEFKMTPEELEDLIVPDLGFDADRKRIFSYGERKFEAILGTDLLITLYSEGKAIRSLPKPAEKYQDDTSAASAAKEELKSVKKQCKLIMDTQKLRMEKAIFTGRSWKREQWEALFLKNPLMFCFAAGLIWEETDADGRLLGTFRYMEDGTFNTVDEEEYELQENSCFMLLHPADISQEELSCWKSQLEDYEIVQPVEQLDLPIMLLSEENKTEIVLADKKGIKIYGASVKSTANKLMCQLRFNEYGECSGFFYETEDMLMVAEVDAFYAGDYHAVVEIQGISFVNKEENRKLPLAAVPVKLLSFAKRAEEMLAAKPVLSQESK